MNIGCNVLIIPWEGLYPFRHLVLLCNVLGKSVLVWTGLKSCCTTPALGLSASTFPKPWSMVVFGSNCTPRSIAVSKSWKNKYHNRVMIENLKRVQMYLNVDDIKIFLISYRLTFFPILECDYKIVGSFICVSTFFIFRLEFCVCSLWK